MSRDRDFAGKVVLITGAGTGMGAATAELLAERGANVVLIGRREKPLRETEVRVNATGSRALVMPLDVTDAQALQQAVDEVVRHFGALHYAVNNAGTASEHADIPDLTINTWNYTLQVNLSSLFYALKAELPAIAAAGGGAVVNVSSVYADRGLPFRSAYSASKHGVRGLTRTAAHDWVSRGIRINELQPGVIDTPMTNEQGTPGEVDKIALTIPAQRIGAPREIATAVAFLLSDDASYVNGAHLAVDGGFLD
ncbi:SDR family NAD(P)-dependent oxidoreductase [Dictyobacter aurantiacus]|uniref:Oxidoreductase n=1 Tax=Dictyobacter aurantiacus TaxID=1936993 RepID=A0A401ZTG2_9CHLR|nr:SDR family oxidoreductase [Dictyobacter aurantiacus]GCE10086.1 oxidoreductase [Dictyobacter aurantiacus]